MACCGFLMGGQPLCKQSCAWDRGLCRQVGTGVWLLLGHACSSCLCMPVGELSQAVLDAGMGD